MTDPYGLPIRLPIIDKMLVGEREQAEIDWLLEHGEFRSEIKNSFFYWRIVRPVPEVYQIWKGTNKADPEADSGEVLITTHTSWDEAINDKRKTQLPLNHWYWFAASPYDWFPYIRNRYNMPFLQKFLRVECGRDKGIVAGCDGSYILVYIAGNEYLARYHPTSDTVYYDEQGEILADYREQKEEEPHAE